MNIFTETFNNLRLANKDNWVFFHDMRQGKEISYKAFNTYIQVMRIDGINHAGSCDVKVSEFKAQIDKAFNYHDIN
jgi:hypothetical protein